MLARHGVGEAIRMARKRRGLYQFQLARRVNISNSEMCRIELGNKVADIDLLCDIAEELGCSEILRQHCQGCTVGARLRQMEQQRRAA